MQSGCGFPTFVRSIFKGKKGRCGTKITVIPNLFRNRFTAGAHEHEMLKPVQHDNIAGFCKVRHGKSNVIASCAKGGARQSGGDFCGLLRHFIPRNDNRVFAFTLAEVLITLVIIGVIAALTIPNLIAKHEKEQTVIKLKKVYTTLNDAFSKIEMEDPDFFESVPSPYDARVWTALDQKLREHLNIYAKCNSKLGDTTNKACVYPQYYNLKGVASDEALAVRYSYIILSDGTYIYFGNQGGPCGFTTSITVDLNGAKKPNTFGKDTFAFKYNVLKDYRRGIIPYTPDGSRLYCDPKNYGRDLLLSADQTHACTKNGTGRTCAALIIKDGWKISDDYPW